MTSKARASKFRHIFGDAAKPEGQYTGIKTPLTSGEGQYLKANPKYLAFALPSGGGPVYIHPLDKTGRFPSAKAKALAVHKGKAVDWDFNPFINNLIATASEDCSCAVTQFPEEGTTTLDSNIQQATATLKGHTKKVALITWNPSANNIVASGAYDRTVKVWDVEKQSQAYSFDGLGDNVYSLAWNANGSQVACTSKDKKLRFFDPRAPEAVQSVDAFDGTKSSKLFWIPRFNWIGSTGYSKTAKRQLRMWDLANLEKPIFSQDLDSQSSVLMPEFDDDLGILYLFGKGDGSVSYYEVQNDDRKVYYLENYRNTEPQKGGGFVPKRGLDVWKCEVARFLKLTSKAIIPVSFIVPRKVGSEVFQEDIYPDALAGKMALSNSDWCAGENKDAVRMALDPAKRTDDDSAGATFTVKKSYDELEQENEALRKRVKELEEKLGINSEES